MLQPKICECGKLCIPLLVTQREPRVNIKASEWHCKDCPASYPMSKEEWVALMQMQKAEGDEADA